jgi:hypothetical protein
MVPREKSKVSGSMVTVGSVHADKACAYAQIGKDRTGLLAAMVLTCCGATVDEIVADYARQAALPVHQMGNSISCNEYVAGMRLAMLYLGCTIPYFLHNAGWLASKEELLSFSADKGPLRRSDDVGDVALGGMEKEELKGLDVSVFARAPPQALLATLEHLRLRLLRCLVRARHRSMVGCRVLECKIPHVYTPDICSLVSTC